MCYNCGCSNPQDDMGSLDNITNQTLKKMADMEGKTLLELQKEFLSELESGSLSPRFESELIQAAKAWGQSVEEAKKNTLSLLKSQVG